MAMNEQKEMFARAIAVGGGSISNRDAAIKAGYSEKTASSIGSRLRKDPEVIAFIEKLNPEMAKSSGVRGNQPAKDDRNMPGGVPVVQTGSFYGVPVTQSGLQVVIGEEEYSLLDPRDLLTLAGMGVISLTPGRIKSLQAVLPYKYGKIGETGKKEAQQAAADEVLQGDMFAPFRAPLGRLQ